MSSEAAVHAHYDPAANRIGMWLFLFTEVLLFGALFIVYAVYRETYPVEFAHAGAELNRVMGTVNTIVLLTSSLAVALGIGALERGDKKRAVQALLATLAMAGVFCVIKAFEWSAKIGHDIYPSSETMLLKPVGEQIYFGLYFAMTGLHALHVVIGAGVLLLAMRRVQRGTTSAARPDFLVNAGLYWHLVDLVWIYLFPLFYLIH
ncbi:MAG: cytochrome c oxidase subunit 3 family protein [Deltaproteobacteria bacterium]|nr:cytochrome c oxidase subunit 3 family protein [Deltaproteobacteria bacterium]